ncbi:FHA domain-containing protein [Pectobacterium brasiliense]|uniref:FHA domain-containing protein n=1 Tax=Pectobacterium brasiliense TaxID=180957 RepID=UPI00406CE808
MNEFISPSSENQPTLFLKKYISPPYPLFFNEVNKNGGVIKSSSGYWICLRYFHTFGRSINCHTVLISPESSHTHLNIFWKKEKWYIQDISKNGTWLNKKKLIKDKHYPIKKTDIITLSLNAEEKFVVTNDLPPCDILISLVPHTSPIYLKKPLTVISENCFFLYDQNGWNVNISDDNKEKKHEIQDGEVIKLFNNHYYLQSAEEKCGQEKRAASRSIDKLAFCFYVSEDEEDIQLQITDAEQSIMLKGERLQNQLYLLLHLARKSIADHVQGYAQSHRGWCDLNSLSKALGIKPNNTRIRVHRLRHRLCDAVNFSGIDACQTLQIKDASVRIYPSQITIIKGGKVE